MTQNLEKSKKTVKEIKSNKKTTADKKIVTNRGYKNSPINSIN